MISLKEDEAGGIIYRQWRASSPPKALLLLIHGIDSHSGRWQFLGDYLLERGIFSYAIELRGFGLTKDIKGHVDSFEVYFNDILRLYDIATRENPGSKVFLAGESAGALVAYLMTVRRPDLFKGLICLSPATQSILPFSFFDYIRLLSLLILSPKKPIAMPFDSAMITRDTEYRKEMDTNGLEHRLATPKMLLNIGLAQARIFLFRNRLRVPVLFLVAGSDKLVNPEASRRLFRSLSVNDKELIDYPEMFHSLSVEYGKEKVFDDISEWLTRRI